METLPTENFRHGYACDGILFTCSSTITFILYNPNNKNIFNVATSQKNDVLPYVHYV
jgi:hypothetical protein